MPYVTSSKPPDFKHEFAISETMMASSGYISPQTRNAYEVVWEMIEKPVEPENVLIFDWRHTRMGGITSVYVVCFTCYRPLRPDYSRSSKAGTHGEKFYIHPSQHDIQHITLVSSNTGNKHYSVSDARLEQLASHIFQKWLKTGKLPDFEDFEEAFNSYMASKCYKRGESGVSHEKF